MSACLTKLEAGVIATAAGEHPRDAHCWDSAKLSRCFQRPITRILLALAGGPLNVSELTRLLKRKSRSSISHPWPLLRRHPRRDYRMILGLLRLGDRRSRRPWPSLRSGLRSSL